MNVPTPIVASSKTLLRGWERGLLVLPALVGLVLGLMLIFLPGTFTALTGFPGDDAYIYRLAGGAILGYGVALSLCVFQSNWLAARLVVVGVLFNNLGSLYACGVETATGQASAAVFVLLATSLLFVIICSLLLIQHQGAPRPEMDFAYPAMRVFLAVGAVAAGVFAIFPLFTPGLFTLFHLHINAPFLIRQAGASSLGYTAAAILAQWALSRQELRLITVMAAIFNGAGGVISIPYLLAGNILFLPWLIGPVGILVFVVALFVLRQMMPRTNQKSEANP